MDEIKKKRGRPPKVKSTAPKISPEPKHTNFGNLELISGYRKGFNPCPKPERKAKDNKATS